jgi:hypothetical protein
LRRQHIGNSGQLGLTFQIHDLGHETLINPNKTNQNKL